MLKRHEVEVLLKAGHRKTEVARMTGVSLRSVKRIAQEETVAHVDDKAERNQRQIGRPSTVQNFRKQVVGILLESPDLASLEILRRVRDAGYQGGKTALYDLVASVRPQPAKPLVRFEGLAGEFSQHYFGEVEVQFLNGTRQCIHFFASRLKYSRWVRISVTSAATNKRNRCVGKSREVGHLSSPNSITEKSFASASSKSQRRPACPRRQRPGASCAPSRAISDWVPTAGAEGAPLPGFRVHPQL